MLETGITGQSSVKVTKENTALQVGSGGLEVFATPAMTALMEKTAYESVQPYLEEGNGTVGTLLNVKHLAATPAGMTVTCTSTLTEVDGRRLVFRVEARDEGGLIGEGTHERFVVQNERFFAKAENRKNSCDI